MKKWIAWMLTAVLLLSMTACSLGNETGAEAFEESRKAFKLVTAAYLETNEFSQDIYEAWYLGVNSKKDYDGDSEMEDFVDEMHIGQSYIEQAVANLLYKEAFEYGDWSTLPYMYNGSHFSAWVSVIAEAYVVSGQVAEIEDKLIQAKDLMKTLSENYADYEHYPVLKEHFTNTLAFLDFCKNPEGSFEQVVETFNTYRNNAREYFFDLNYVFEDSISGMSEFVAEDTLPMEETIDPTATENATAYTIPAA